MNRIQQTRDTLHKLQLTLTETLGQNREAMLEKLALTTQSLTGRIDEQLALIAGKVNERLDEGFKKTNETFTSVMTRLATIDEAQKKIEAEFQKRDRELAGIALLLGALFVAGSLLAQMGATVIAVESRSTGAFAEPKWRDRTVHAAGKLCIAIDASSPTERALLVRLASASEIFSVKAPISS